MSTFGERAKPHLEAIYRAALAAADPEAAVLRTLRRDGDALEVGARSYDLKALQGVQLLAVGKAAAAMARGAGRAWGEAIIGGLAVTSRGNAKGDAPVPVLVASHPVPDEASVAGARGLLDHARWAGSAGNLVLALISGGASALAELPAPPLTLGDLQQTTELLLRSGASISQMNAVRKHLSAFKGGQLALAASPAPMVTLVLSDVVGSRLDAIGSGPTVPDPTTWAEVERVLAAHDLLGRVPAAVAVRLTAGVAGEVADTPKPDHPVFANGEVRIVGDASLAAEAAREAAVSLGFHAHVVTSRLEGDAEQFARSLVAEVRLVRAGAGPVGRPACLIFAGETTVVVRGKGRGGRNQQLALAFAAACDGDAGVALAALATDGIDGPTDAAGAIVDGDTASRLRAAGIDLDKALRDNDAGTALDAAQALVRCGPTGTNVNDLVLLLVE